MGRRECRSRQGVWKAGLYFRRKDGRLIPERLKERGIEHGCENNRYRRLYHLDRPGAGFCTGRSGGAKFHLNQALVIWLAGLLSFIPCIGWLWGIFCFICAVMGFISAVNGEEKAVPLLGQIRLLK